MNIEQAIKNHERLADLLDRRSRLLEDLRELDEELSHAMEDVKSDVACAQEVTQKALPPGGAPGPSGGAKKSTKKRASRGKFRGPVLQYFQDRPKQHLTSKDVIEGTGLEKRCAQSTIMNLCRDGIVRRVSRGVYQLA